MKRLRSSKKSVYEMFGVTSRQSSINTEPEMSENEGMRDVIHYVNKLQDRAVNRPSRSFTVPGEGPY